MRPFPFAQILLLGELRCGALPPPWLIPAATRCDSRQIILNETYDQLIAISLQCSILNRTKITPPHPGLEAAALFLKRP
jgi:hypothetical protein